MLPFFPFKSWKKTIYVLGPFMFPCETRKIKGFSSQQFCSTKNFMMFSLKQKMWNFMISSEILNIWWKKGHYKKFPKQLNVIKCIWVKMHEYILNLKFKKLGGFLSLPFSLKVKALQKKIGWKFNFRKSYCFDGWHFQKYKWRSTELKGFIFVMSFVKKM